LKIIAWNIARRADAWRLLVDSDADIALLQTAPNLAQPASRCTGRAHQGVSEMAKWTICPKKWITNSAWSGGYDQVYSSDMEATSFEVHRDDGISHEFKTMAFFAMRNSAAVF
jgi:hypothetical protein